MFSIFKKRAPATATGWHRALTPDGIHVGRQGVPGSDQLEEQALDGLLTQLLDDGFAQQDGAGHLISWDSFFAAADLPAYANLDAVFGLPAATSMRVALSSRDSLTDKTFSISVSVQRHHVDAAA
jgi:hypothetical protein